MAKQEEHREKTPKVIHLENTQWNCIEMKGRTRKIDFSNSWKLSSQVQTFWDKCTKSKDRDTTDTTNAYNFP